MKGGEFESADWAIHNNVFNKDVIQVATTDVLPTYMQDGLEDTPEGYSSKPPE